MLQTSRDLIWWHFSDLHWEAGKSDERKRFLNALFSDLQSCIEEHGVPDFIVFSGDVSNSGSDIQFREAKINFFDPILKLCSPNSVPILLVPGNHDLSREQARFINPELITVISSTSQLDEFLDNDIAQKNIISPFTNFQNHANDISG